MKKSLLVLMMILTAFLVRAQNNPPVAVNDTINVEPGEYVTVNVLENDYDPEGDDIKVIYANGPLVDNYTETTVSFKIPEIEWYLDTNDMLILSSELYYKIQDENFNTSEESLGNVFFKITSYEFAGDYLDVNNIRAWFNPFGKHFENIHMPFNPRYEFPKGSGKNTSYTTSLWIGGKNNNDELHLSAERFRQLGTDYWCGPLSADGNATTDSATVEEWQQVWKISKAQVYEHMMNWQNPNYQAPDVILNWPAHGDTNLNQSYYLAPFVDMNNNGHYEPMAGDVPLVRGHQTIFFIFNDQKVHGETGGTPIGLEIHGMAWAFTSAENPAVENTIFLSYKIINRSSEQLNDVYAGLFYDFDIGNALDDYVGCDVERGTFYGYNSDDYDEVYGENIPSQAIVILGGPEMDPDNLDNPSGECNESINGVGFGDGIIDNERYGMNSFIYWNNNSGPQGDPIVAEEYYNYLQAIWVDGTAMEYGGNGHINSGAYGPATKFMFPGLSDSCNWGTGGVEPFGPVNWTEETAGNEPFDRRGLSSMGPFTLQAGETKHLDIAFVTAMSDNKEKSSVELMKDYVDNVRSFYEEDPKNFGYEWLSTSENTAEQKPLKIYPNPAYNRIYVDMPGSFDENAIYNIYNVYGSRLKSDVLEHEIQISGLEPGLYILEVISAGNKYLAKFIKE